MRNWKIILLASVVILTVAANWWYYSKSRKEKERPSHSKKADITPMARPTYSEQPEIFPMPGREDTVTSLAFSSDGKLLAVGNGDWSVTLWDATKRYQRSTFEGHKTIVSSVAFSPDNKLLVTGSFDRTVKLWDVTTGQSTATLKGHSGEITSVAFSPNGDNVASGSRDGTVIVWNLGTNQPQLTFREHIGHVGYEGVRAVAFSPDGTTIASGQQRDGIVMVWDPKTGKVLHTFKLKSDKEFLRALVFAPNAKTLAVAGRDHVIFWNWATGKARGSLPTIANSLSFSLDGNILATGDRRGKVKLWDLSTNTQILTIDTGAKGHTPVVFSPDGKILATGGKGGNLRWWDSTDGKELFDLKFQEQATLQGHTARVEGVAYSSDGRTLATASNNRIVLWNMPAQKVRTMLEPHGLQASSIVFSPDGRVLAAASRQEGTVTLWDTATGQIRTMLKGHEKGIESLAFSPDGKSFATASSDRTVKLWNFVTGEQLATYQWHTGRSSGSYVESIEFSPDGNTIATAASRENTVRLWDVSTGQLQLILEGHTSTFGATDVAFAPDGKTLASAGGNDKVARLWDIARGESRAVLRGHKGEVLSVAFSPNGETLATSSADRSVKLWDVATGEELATLRRHSDEVLSVAFSPDGKTLASSSADKTVKIWDIDGKALRASLKKKPSASPPAQGSPKLRVRLYGHSDVSLGSVSAMAFSPDSKMLATAGGHSDVSVRLWDVQTGQLRADLGGYTTYTPFISFIADGKTLVTGSSDGTIKLWDLTSNPPLGTIRLSAILKDKGRSIWRWAFTPDAKLVATVDRYGKIVLWNGLTGHMVAKFEGHAKSISAAEFSPDGRFLVTASERDGIVKLWNVASSQQQLSFQAKHIIKSVRFSQDGRKLAIEGGGKISLWDLSTVREQTSFRVEPGIESLRFSTDGSILATGGGDWRQEGGIVKLWTVSGQHRQTKLNAHASPVIALAFSVNRTMLATGSRGGIVALWDISGEELRDKKLAEKNLSRIRKQWK